MRRARRILLHGGTEQERAWAFAHLVETAGLADPYDGRLPGAAAESLLKSDVSALPEEALRKLAAVLYDTTTGIALYQVAELLVLIPKQRVLKYLDAPPGKIDASKHPYNAASIAYVRAMHGDTGARASLIALARKEPKRPGFLQNYYVRVLRRSPREDGEAEWYFREGHRLWIPPELSGKVDASGTTRTLDMILLPIERFFVEKCRTDYKVKEPLTGEEYLRPPGAFFTEYGHYPGRAELAGEQETAASRLLGKLDNDGKTVLTRTLAAFYHLDSDGFTLERLLLGWLTDVRPFRLFGP